MTARARRAAGVLLLAGAVLCAVVVARIDGVRVGGTAMVPSGRAPAVGDCLAAVTDASTAGPLAAGAPSPTSVVSVGEQFVAFSDCTGEHIGEVVSYRRMPGQSGHADPATEPSGVTTAAASSDTQWCVQVAAGYRSHSSWRVKNASGGLWVPSTGQRFAAILSAPADDPAEPRWAACAVLSPRLESFRGSYVRSLAEESVPAPFGRCRFGDLPDRWVSCVTPHRTQEFGTGTGQQVPAREGIAACRSLIREMTGMSDITGDGLLRTEVVGGAGPDYRGGDYGGDFGGAESTDANASTTVGSCRLSMVGEAKLVGTLVGIGDRPLPLG